MRSPSVVQTAIFTMMGFVLVAMTSKPTSAQRYPVAVGDQHFDFEFPSIADGKPVKLSDYRGKKILLIHFASW